MKNFNRNVILHDSNWNKFDIECEITNRNGYPEFSMSWEWWWSSWQNEDNIKPRTDNQRKLLDLWDNWHLNWMRAWTEKQMKLLRDYKITINANDYNNTVDYLQKHKFDWSELTVTEYDRSMKAIQEYKDSIDKIYSKDIFISAYVDMHEWMPYLYWHSWIRKTLPDDFKDNLVMLLDELDSEEEEYNSNPITIDMLESDIIIDKANDLDITPEKLMAMCLYLNVSIEWLDNISKWYWDNNFEIEWTNYLVCTDDEADEEVKKYIEQNCCYFNASFLAEQTDLPKEVFEWLIDKDQAVWRLIEKTCWTDEFVETAISADWRWHFINSYDWYEYTQDVWDETFYLYKT